MTHKFAVVVDKKFYNNIQNNNDFYLRVIVLDVIRALVEESDIAKNIVKIYFINVLKVFLTK
jgi:hypothetical protein